MYFGTRHASKMTALVIAALHGLDAAGIDYRLRVIGELEVDHPRATVLGYLDEQKLATELCSAHLALLPYTDGASTRRTTVINSLAAGLAVVSTHGRDTDAALHTALVLTDPAPDAYARAVVELATDPERRAAVAAAGSRWFEATAAWAATEPHWRVLFHPSARVRR